ncbi:MAG: VanZ family protein [Minicystis sp.]
MTSFFRTGFILYLAMDVLIGAGAYAGVLPTMIHGLPHFDLVMHLILIGGVAFFLDGALGHRPLWRGRGSLAGAGVIVVAGIEEWAQRFSPRRSSTWSDFAADVVGVILFVWLARQVTAKWQERRALESA